MLNCMYFCVVEGGCISKEACMLLIAQVNKADE